MAEESLNLPTENLEFHIVTLFEKLESLRREQNAGLSTTLPARIPMQAEVRTLEFWRSIISECLASFFYVFIVCGAAAGAGVGATTSSILLATALASGFAMTTLTQCFGHVSGAHVNPAVSVAMAVTRNISVLRAAMFVTAQCGGGIAGAALLYGVTVPGYQGNLQAAVAQTASLASWERFGVEFILTFVVVFSYYVSMECSKKWTGNSALVIGAAYSACSFVSMPYLNPARSLGPAFVLNKWDSHWVYWFGPLVGGVASGLVYEFIFNPRRHDRKPKDSIDGDSSSINSDEENYDDLDKPNQPKFHGSTYNTYRPAGGSNGPSANGPAGYCPSLTSTSLYSAPPSKLDRVESLYGGTKSLYCKSPPLTRANLNRSQSVYTKSNSAINRDLGPRPGPLVPAQSLYPMRLNQQQQTHVQNQNVQNQMQQRTEGMYGARGLAAGLPPTRPDGLGQGYSQTANSAIYGTRANPGNGTGVANDQNMKFETREENTKFTRTNRPESMYGMSGQRRGQSAQSDDSSYGSYHGSNTAPRSGGNGNYATSNPGQNYPSKANAGSGPAGPSNFQRGATIPGQEVVRTSNVRQPQPSPNLQY